jgi:hypothetical protein
VEMPDTIGLARTSQFRKNIDRNIGINIFLIT